MSQSTDPTVEFYQSILDTKIALELSLRPDGAKEIWVCDKCLQASCWAGIFMCQHARDANIIKITKARARAMGLEHDYYLNLPEVQA